VKTHVHFSDHSRAQAEQAERWWRENRTAAPSLLTDELSRTVEILKEHPEIGRPFPRPEAPGLRVVPLRRTRHLVYYTYSADNAEVLIVTVWSGLREHGPPIRIP